MRSWRRPRAWARASCSPRRTCLPWVGSPCWRTRKVPDLASSARLRIRAMADRAIPDFPGVSWRRARARPRSPFIDSCLAGSCARPWTWAAVFTIRPLASAARISVVRTRYPPIGRCPRPGARTRPAAAPMKPRARSSQRVGSSATAPSTCPAAGASCSSLIRSAHCSRYTRWRRRPQNPLPGPARSRQRNPPPVPLKRLQRDPRGSPRGSPRRSLQRNPSGRR